MSSKAMTTLVAERLAAAGDPEKAAGMAAYMKTTMPFYGVQKAGRTPIVRDVTREFPPSDRLGYEENVLALWRQPHREEKYIALGYARAFPDFIEPDSLPCYRRLVTDGAWWDLVDETAIKLVGVVLRNHRSDTTAWVTELVDTDDLWLRRTAIICQIGHKEATDTSLLSTAIDANTDDTDFFIRKAIGWSLREYAKTDPEWVRRFVGAREGVLSPLSKREAMKHL